MVEIDMTRPDRELRPGIDLWVVTSTVPKTSKSSGAPMLAVELGRDVPGGMEKIIDNVMLAGGGWGLGKAKLIALGVPQDFSGNLDLSTITGRRVWVATIVETYQGKSRLKVDISQLEHAGYQAEANVPPGCVLPVKTATFADDGTPF